MGCHQRPQPTGRSMIVAVFVLTLLVASGGQAGGAANPGRSKSPLKPAAATTTEKLRRRRLPAFDPYFSSKRRVPNASDPLHNR
ncbi:hypothetical protein CDL15_Pgr014501 [Punica granatum]|uniref:CLAVATA3/ESR (CLE)-related protein 25-like n=1 Tax=Punica granatum TaxID=22663 RepID=A0A218WEC7_PUNGR|nr:hypothetical protein CDL15_Pgr014501 [Punica granatum]PKI79364.1 hypothetical protein CRG98_000242 [Punica granatum]